MSSRSVGEAIAGRALSGVCPAESFLYACKVLADNNVSAAPVIDAARLVGVFSERDVVCRVVLRQLPPGKTAVSDVMTPEPITVREETSLVQAMEQMLRGGVRHLPVIRAGDCIGMLSMQDIPSDYRLQFSRYDTAPVALQHVTRRAGTG